MSFPSFFDVVVLDDAVAVFDVADDVVGDFYDDGSSSVLVCELRDREIQADNDYLRGAIGRGCDLTRVNLGLEERTTIC